VKVSEPAFEIFSSSTVNELFAGPPSTLSVMKPSRRRAEIDDLPSPSPAHLHFEEIVRAGRLDPQ